MQWPDPSDNFTLEIKDFGPIKSANVGLRPLTVFVGPSNTGKSYLAILAYALHNCFGRPRFPRYGRLGGYFPKSSETASVQTSKMETLALRECLRSVRKWLTDFPEDIKRPPSVPQDVEERLRLDLEQAADIDQYVESELVRCFGVEHTAELSRRVEDNPQARITVKIPRCGEEPAILSNDLGANAASYQIDFARGRKSSASGSISVDTPIQVRAEYAEELRRDVLFGRWSFGRTSDLDDASDKEMRYLMRKVEDSLLLSIFHPLNSNAFYLPASRSGVMHSHQTVVSALIQGATAAGRRPMPGVPVLSGVLADFLNELFALSHKPVVVAPRMRRKRARFRRQFEELADRLEERILRGDIDVERGETNYPIFSYQPIGWENELPLMRTSSMVSELAPVVLYLRYLVRPGDLFILEEPESHLHPAMQAAFARELVRLVRSGVRVLLTTHSEWFLEQIGNLVRLSELPEDKRSGISGDDIALGTDQVGAWLFKPRPSPGGSVVEEIGLEQETGLYPAGYDDVSEALYNEGAEIFNRLQESAAE